MNKLAVELNKTLKNTTAFKQLSDYGKRIYFPIYGIVEQSKEASAKAKLYNATIGMAVYQGKPLMVPAIREHFASLKESEIVSYSNSYGDKELRDLWKNEIYRKNPSLGDTKISTPIVVSGLTGGISQVAQLFVNKDENVLCPDMYWENYDLIFDELCQANLKKFKFYDKNYALNVNGLEKAIYKYAIDKKITLIINFPNNPTGYSPTKDDVANLKEVLLKAAKSGIRITTIIDDAYFGLFYDDDTFKESLFSVLANLHKNIFAIKVDGATKEHFVWGFRIGFVTFACPDLNDEQLKALEQKLAGSVRASVSSCSKVAQSILTKALKDNLYENNRLEFDALLKKRYNKVQEILAKKESSIIKPLKFNSGYFMCFEVNGNSEKLRKILVDEYEIGAISVQDKYLRVAFSSVDMKNLEDLYSKIFEAAEKLK